MTYVVKNGRTALIQASQNGKTKVVELLLKFNARVNTRTKVNFHYNYH